MSLTKNPYYDNLCTQINPYQAIMQVAKDSRQMCLNMPHRIEMSEAMDFVSKGEKPDPNKYIDHRMDRVEDYLCGVSDSEVADAVRISYAKSLEYNNLVYVYDKVHDKYRRAKVRIILRMLWQDGPYA